MEHPFNKLPLIEILLISDLYAGRKMSTSLVHIYFTENVN